MLKEKIQRKIEGQFECIEEILRSVNEHHFELTSKIETIRYLTYLINNDNKKEMQ